MDFQEAFLLVFAYPIMLILGVTLAGGLLIALAQAPLIGFRKQIETEHDE